MSEQRIKKQFRAIPVVIMSCAMLAFTGCAVNQSMSKDKSEKNGQLTKQFGCADRNGNDYIDKAELVYLAECGVVHESLSDQEVAEMSEKSAFENGRRFLETMDANGDDQISLLELRAHFNATN